MCCRHFEILSLSTCLFFYLSSSNKVGNRQVFSSVFLAVFSTFKYDKFSLLKCLFQNKKRKSSEKKRDAESPAIADLRMVKTRKFSRPAFNTFDNAAAMSTILFACSGQQLTKIFVFQPNQFAVANLIGKMKKINWIIVVCFSETHPPVRRKKPLSFNRFQSGFYKLVIRIESLMN